MEWYVTLTIVLVPLFALMLAGLPVAFAFLAINLVGSYILMGGFSGVEQLVLNTVGSVTSFTLIPIALFMIMGEAMFRSGIAIDLMDTLDKWFGKLRGRLALMAVGGGVLFSTLTGNSMGSIALLGIVADARDGTARLCETDVARAHPRILGPCDHDPAVIAGGGSGRDRRYLDRTHPDRHHRAGALDGVALRPLHPRPLPPAAASRAVLRCSEGQPGRKS